MFNRLNRLMKASLFYLITFTLAVLLAIFGQGLGKLVLVVTMFTPLVAVLLMLLVVTRDGYTRTGWQTLGLHRLGWQRWGLAVLGPLLVLSCTYAIVWSIGIGRPNWAALGKTLALGGLVSLLLNLIVDMILALGEEIGWRGYLLPHLLPLGRTQALLLSGFGHGLWHLPVMLLTPFYHESGNRLLVAALFVLSTTCGGVFFGYLRLKSGSVWPAVSDFTEVNFTGFGELTLVQGETEGLTIETDDNLLPYLKTTVDQGTLTIGFDDGLSLPLMQPTDSIRYQLTVKTLTDLALSGAGTVEATALTADHLTLVGSGIGAIKLADLTADAITVEMSGAGAIELAGAVTQQTVVLSGLGNYEATDLASQIAEVTLSGAGEATIWVSAQLDAEMSGAGTINYYGSPQTNASSAGIGMVKHLGDK